MPIDCLVLGKDVEITDETVPVISPYWRLKQSGDWILLHKYDSEQISYSVLSPLMGATVDLFNGRLSFRQLSMIVQYAHDIDALEEARGFLFRHPSSAGSKQKRPAAPLSLNLMFSNTCQTNCAYCYAHRRPVPPLTGTLFGALD